MFLKIKEHNGTISFAAQVSNSRTLKIFFALTINTSLFLCLFIHMHPGNNREINTYGLFWKVADVHSDIGLIAIRVTEMFLTNQHRTELDSKPSLVMKKDLNNVGK